MSLLQFYESHRQHLDREAINKLTTSVPRWLKIIQEVYLHLQAVKALSKAKHVSAGINDSIAQCQQERQ